MRKNRRVNISLKIYNSTQSPGAEVSIVVRVGGWRGGEGRERERERRRDLGLFRQREQMTFMKKGVGGCPIEGGRR